MRAGSSAAALSACLLAPQTLRSRAARVRRITAGRALPPLASQAPACAVGLPVASVCSALQMPQRRVRARAPRGLLHRLRCDARRKRGREAHNPHIICTNERVKVCQQPAQYLLVTLLVAPGGALARAPPGASGTRARGREEEPSEGGFVLATQANVWGRMVRPQGSEACCALHVRAHASSLKLLFLSQLVCRAAAAPKRPC